MGHIPFLFSFINFFRILKQWGNQEAVILVSILLFLFCLLYLYRCVQQRCQVKEAERIRTMMKSLRHDWMNHVQVIMGYQLLKQYDKVDQYLQKLTKKSLDERMISELTYPPLAAALLTLPYDYAQWNWKIRLNDSLTSLTIRQQRKLFQILHHLLPWITNKIASRVAWTEIEFDLSYEKQCFFFTFRLIGKDSEQTHKLQPLNWGVLPKRLCFQKASYEWSEKKHTLLLKMPIR